ncbi:DNA-binding SARP family transcriptional activator [Kibdelosporangium banguiense]|uniref:DNA-binding SARP family transcriptional activator n=1 Tax=Kibdelosporangium banguiense TaxID=1365924 RepID=A0ABS4TN98_9PSEU|nr:BTAD domain-containing putative transcriptional regulator [Kibdelosporangium banguiense]MBP2325881.1 DNA-binding SARP family transcriptional activator [Kibdelosporangium banguiense]
MVTFGVLGPLVAEDGLGPVGLRGPRHRAVLARLLIARRRVVPVRSLVADLWDDPPDGAVGAIQTFIGALRQAIEPDRPPRTPARLLVTSAPGYALRAEPDAVDAWRFEAALAESAELLSAGRADTALSCLDSALALWRGPAYSEFSDEHWARAEITRLDELRLLAVERRAEAGLELGRAADVAADLRAHVADHPWREHGWRLLALALYRSGRQGEALAALRAAKDVFVADLGLDPGPELRKLEADMLVQAPELTPSVAHELIGRDAELAQLTAAAKNVLARRKLGLVLVSGDAGAGKTALAEALADRLGWTTAWGRNPEGDGVPSAWPWTQILTSLAKAGRGSTRFELHQAVVSYVASAAEPLLLILDDLHRAGEDTLALLGALLASSLPRAVLIVATFRSTEISAELTELLARAARAEPVRIYVGGLSLPAVGELVRATTHRDVSAATAKVIHERSGGNPFFVRELARLFSSDGESALSGVPAGVRDVIRHRLLALPDAARTVLRQAAVIGHHFDLDLLIPLSGNEDVVLDTVDSALPMGFLVETGGLRFAHALVRDALYEEISVVRRGRWHAAVAEILERLRPDDVEALAHHFLLAEGHQDKTVRYAAAAAERAERRFAPHEAARLWQAALDVHDGDARTRLDLIMGLGRALAVTGELETARQHRAAALAEDLGDPVLTAQVIGAFDVPGIWTTNDDPALAEQIVAITERTLTALPPDMLALRSRLLSTIAMELRGTRSPRGRDAATEAEAIARRLADPGLLAFALNGRFMHTFERAGLAPQRAAIGRELVSLAANHELVAFEVLGHLILMQAHSALAEFSTADSHAAAADRLGDQHEIPLVGVFTDWYSALRGPRSEAEAKYRAAAARLSGTGMRGMEPGLLPLALLSLQPELKVDLTEDWGPYLPWVQPLGLLSAGDHAGAVAALHDVPDSPRDLLYEARVCLLAAAASQLGQESVKRWAHRELLPAAGELAGAGSGLLSFGPVSRFL